MISAQRAHELLDFDPETGLLRWRLTRGKAKAGLPATCRKDGYVVIRLDGTLYRAHRIAWLMTHGGWPNAEIDHIDGNRSNNAIANLRECVGEIVNQHNEHGLRRNNKSGYAGVSWSSVMCKWEAAIKVNYRRRVIGYFDDAAQASAARSLAKAALHAASMEGRNET